MFRLTRLSVARPRGRGTASPRGNCLLLLGLRGLSRLVSAVDSWAAIVGAFAPCGAQRAMEWRRAGATLLAA